jgi:hypothetical protein
VLRPSRSSSAHEQEPGIAGHHGSPGFDAELGVERESNRARFRVIHWVGPSALARSPREPRFLRVLSDYGPIRSAFKSKMWVQNLLSTAPGGVPWDNFCERSAPKVLTPGLASRA